MCKHRDFFLRQTPASDVPGITQLFIPEYLEASRKTLWEGTEHHTGGKRTFFSILKYVSASGLHITIRFSLLACYLSSFVQNCLAGSSTLSSRFKANVKDIIKAKGTVRFCKAFLYHLNEILLCFLWKWYILNRPLIMRNMEGEVG